MKTNLLKLLRSFGVIHMVKYGKGTSVLCVTNKTKRKSIHIQISVFTQGG